MDRHATTISSNAALRRFAQHIHDELGAQHVLLFGSRARGRADPDSDYGIVVVSPRFQAIPAPLRAAGLRQM